MTKNHLNQFLEDIQKKNHVNCFFLPTKHKRVHMNSFKRVSAFQIELEFGSVGFWAEEKTGVPGEKPLGARERTNNKLNHIWRRRRDLNPAGHIGGRRVLSPLRHPCSLPRKKKNRQDQSQKIFPRW